MTSQRSRSHRIISTSKWSSRTIHDIHKENYSRNRRKVSSEVKKRHLNEISFVFRNNFVIRNHGLLHQILS